MTTRTTTHDKAIADKARRTVNAIDHLIRHTLIPNPEFHPNTVELARGPRRDTPGAPVICSAPP